MPPREVNILIHQALHGYAHGHRLLESSLKISSSSARTIQLNSDMSGPSMVGGFESYLTSYPLPEMNMYALGKTWYAPEMSRPGCVWTHTLLINNADLAQLTDLSQLLNLFIRPSINGNFDEYKAIREIFSLSDNTNLHRLPHVHIETAKGILKCLYEFPSQPVYVETKSAQQFEEIIISIWSQQWPRLRRSFKFCTGSLSNRKTDGQNFDLQVIPKSARSAVQHESPSAKFVSDCFSESVGVQPQNELPLWFPAWPEIAASDLILKSQLSDFLWRFGADQTEGRAAFVPLVEVYIGASMVKAGKASLAALLGSISNHFPQPSQAVRLKQALFGAVDSSKGLLYPEIAEKDLLKALVITGYSSAFKSGTLSIKNRAQSLLQAEHSAAKELTFQLLTDELSPIGEEFLAGVCESISIDDALDLAKAKPSLLPLIIHNNPQLLTEPLLWKCSTDLQREIFDVAIKSSNLDDGFIQRLIPILLEIGSDTLAEDIIYQLDENAAVDAILDWFDQDARKGLSSLGARWQRNLERHQSMVIDWLIKKSAKSIPRVTTLALASSILNPHSRLVINAGSEIWLALAREGQAELDSETLIRAMSFLLALGFNNPSPSGAELVAKSFEIVHQAAMHNLSYRDWRLLQEQAPSISFWKSWDKCERLRCALIENFIKFRWPSEFFLEALSNIDTFSRTLDCSDMTGRGRKFIRRLAREVRNGSLIATHQQTKMLLYF